MELLISVVIMVGIVLFSVYVLHKGEQKKTKAVQTLMSSYEESCKEQCQTTREVTDRFMEVSAENLGSIRDLHKRTLEILSGEKLDV